MMLVKRDRHAAIRRLVTVQPVASQGELVDLHGDHAVPFCAQYGIEPSGAVLVRPDGYVAWHAAAFSPEKAERFAEVLGKVLSRPVHAQAGVAA